MKSLAPLLLVSCAMLPAPFRPAHAAEIDLFLQASTNTGNEADVHYATPRGQFDLNEQGGATAGVTAVAPWRAVGSASATGGVPAGNGNSHLDVSLYSAAIHASADGLWQSGNNQGQLHDLVTFDNPFASFTQIDVRWSIDGELAPQANGSAVAGADGRFGIQQVGGDPGPNNTATGNVGIYSASISRSGSDPVQSNQSLTFDPDMSPFVITPAASGFGYIADILISLDPGLSTYRLDEVFGVNAGNATADFADTSALAFILPPGVTFTSDSGVLFTRDPSVPTGALPEPGVLALLALGLIAVPAGRVRRRGGGGLVAS